jgi:transcriptional regulator with XRE-family HTH domain
MAKYRRFGLFIRAARILADLDGADVAKAIGLAPNTYSAVERGSTMISLEVLAAICRVLHIDAHELLPRLDCKSAPITSTSNTKCPSERIRTWGEYGHFGRLLIEARRQRQLTIEQVAQATGGSMVQYYRLENGHSLPRVETFAKLWHCLGFDANRLLKAMTKTGQAFWLGAYIADARTLRAMAQIEVAALVGCTVEQYQRIEQGAELPTLTTFVRLYRVLKFDLQRALRMIP